jgi:hypothetical protein
MRAGAELGRAVCDREPRHVPREFRDQAARRSFSSPSHVAFAPVGSDEPWIQRATMLAPFYLCSPYLMARCCSYTEGYWTGNT